MKKFWMISLLMLSAASVVADDDVFTVATLNVNGLPTHILGININPDGPGGETWRTGKSEGQVLDPFRQVKIYLEFDIIDYFCKRNEIWNKNK